MFSDFGGSLKCQYMNNESKCFCYKPLNTTHSGEQLTMPSNTDPETKLVIATSDLPKLSKIAGLKVSFDISGQLNTQFKYNL